MDQALPLDDVEYDVTVEETGDISEFTAEQYLSWVRQQAKNIPVVVRAQIEARAYDGNQTQYMPEIEAIQDCPDYLASSDNWNEEVLNSFSELRLTLDRMSCVEEYKERKVCVPTLKDGKYWHLFCLGTVDKTGHCEQNDVTNATGNYKSEDHSLEVEKDNLMSVYDLNPSLHDSAVTEQLEQEVQEPQAEAESAGASVTDSTVQKERDEKGGWTGAVAVAPSTRLMLQFDQVMTQRLFEHHVQWLQHCEDVTELQGKWMYSLLARMEKPLCSDVVAMIRQVYRCCCRLRALLQRPDIGLTDSDHDNDNDQCAQFETKLAMLNMLIVITGTYFGQAEHSTCFTEHAASSSSSAATALAGTSGVEVFRRGQSEEFCSSEDCAALEQLIGEPNDDNDDMEEDDDEYCDDDDDDYCEAGKLGAEDHGDSDDEGAWGGQCVAESESGMCHFSSVGTKSALHDSHSLSSGRKKQRNSDHTDHSNNNNSDSDTRGHAEDLEEGEEPELQL